MLPQLALLSPNLIEGACGVWAMMLCRRYRLCVEMVEKYEGLMNFIQKLCVRNVKEERGSLAPFVATTVVALLPRNCKQIGGFDEFLRPDFASQIAVKHSTKYALQLLGKAV